MFFALLAPFCGYSEFGRAAEYIDKRDQPQRSAKCAKKLSTAVYNRPEAQVRRRSRRGAFHRSGEAFIVSPATCPS